MKATNVFNMETWVHKAFAESTSLAKTIQDLSNSLAAMKATTDFHAGVVDNTHPKHSSESFAYMKKYNELRNKHERS